MVFSIKRSELIERRGAGLYSFVGLRGAGGGREALSYRYSHVVTRVKKLLSLVTSI